MLEGGRDGFGGSSGDEMDLEGAVAARRIWRDQWWHHHHLELHHLHVLSIIISVFVFIFDFC